MNVNEVKRAQILKLVYASIEMINEQRDLNYWLELKEDTCLRGRKSRLDSLGVVTLIVDVEERLAIQLGIEVSLTDEEAMSEEKNHLANVKSLVDYICLVLEGKKNGQ
jgi:acyl carrier protein